MPMSEKKKASNKKWDVANIDRLSIATQKGEREKIKAAAAEAGESVNQYIIGAISARMNGPSISQQAASAPRTAEQGEGVPPTPAEQESAPVLSVEALEMARRAAAAAGEDLPAFLARAVKQTADTDARQRPLSNASFPSPRTDEQDAPRQVPGSGIDWAEKTARLWALREEAKARVGISDTEQQHSVSPEQPASGTPGSEQPNEKVPEAST